MFTFFTTTTFKSDVVIPDNVMDILANNLIQYIPPMAVVTLFIAGFMMLTPFSEDHAKKARNVMGTAVGALLLTGLINPIKSFMTTVINGGTQSLVVNIQNFVVNDILGLIITTLQTLSGVAAILFATLAGYHAITSLGDSDKIQEAKGAGINVLVALAIIGLSETFLKTVLSAEKGSKFAMFTEVTGKTAVTNMIGFIANFVNIALSTAGMIAVAMIVFGGYKILFSGEGETEEGGKIVMHALVGLVIIMVSFAITNITYNFIF